MESRSWRSRCWFLVWPSSFWLAGGISHSHGLLSVSVCRTREISGVSPFFLKGLQFYWVRAPPSRPHLTFITVINVPSLNTIVLGIRASTCAFFFCCSLSHVQLFVTPWIVAHRLIHPSLSPGVLKFMSIELIMLSNHLILCCPLFLLSSILPASGS